MRIDNGRYREVLMDWSNITPPLLAGTPISAAGEIANTSEAIGIVPATVVKQNVMPRSIYVLDAGDVDLAEVEYESRLTLTDDCKRAIAGVTFHSADGSVPGAGMLLTVTEDDGTYTLDKTWSEIVAALNKGTIPFFLYEDSVMVMAVVQAYQEGNASDETPWQVYTSDNSTWTADDPDETLTLYTEGE